MSEPSSVPSSGMSCMPGLPSGMSGQAGSSQKQQPGMLGHHEGHSSEIASDQDMLGPEQASPDKRIRIDVTAITSQATHATSGAPDKTNHERESVQVTNGSFLPIAQQASTSRSVPMTTKYEGTPGPENVHNVSPFEKAFAHVLPRPVLEIYYNMARSPATLEKIMTWSLSIRATIGQIGPKSLLAAIDFDMDAVNSSGLEDCDLWILCFILINVFGPEEHVTVRDRLPAYTTLQHAAHLVNTCKKILIVSGAGISVSAGIPDFRSKTGLYATLHKTYPELRDPADIFALQFFITNQKPFFRFAKEIFPGKYGPTPTHRFIKALEKSGRLLRNYSQNIDSLEDIAGIERKLLCHGTFLTSTCLRCKFKSNTENFRGVIESEDVVMCPNCGGRANLEGEAEMPPVMKPDITFFGEDLPKKFHDQFAVDRSECDLLIVIGTSMSVKPVCLIPAQIDESVPQILINKKMLYTPYLNFDIELYGCCDTIIEQISHLVGDEHFTELASKSERLQHMHDLHDVYDVMDELLGECDVDDAREASALEVRARTTHEVSTHLDDGKYMFIPPNMSIFPGSEVTVSQLFKKRREMHRDASSSPSDFSSDISTATASECGDDSDDDSDDD